MAQMRDADRAWVPPPKLTSYLLAITHPAGGPKARFLMSFGFAPGSPDVLEAALHRHAATGVLTSSSDTAYGREDEVEGPMLCPDGTIIHVKTVWISDSARGPRFVTLVPGKRVKP